MIGFAHDASPIRKITRARRGPFRRAAAICAGAALSGCSGDLSVLDPAGPAARDIATLWWAMLAGGAVLFLLVMGLFALTMLKPGFGGRWRERTWIVGGGILMPVPVLALLLFFAFAMGERHLPWRGEHNPVRIEARAHMWYWEFRYPDYPDATPTIGVMHMPARYDVDVIATSDNVIHGFWVPRLGGKVDATPGHETVVRLYADRPGAYGGICAEYCGTGHTAMTFRVEAHTPEDFRAAISGGAP
ncbi:MAG: cytochrome c oxidase subunit II [Parvibaculum sp.]